MDKHIILQKLLTAQCSDKGVGLESLNAHTKTKATFSNHKGEAPFCHSGSVASRKQGLQEVACNSVTYLLNKKQVEIIPKLPLLHMTRTE
eukprot:g73322.t1